MPSTITVDGAGDDAGDGAMGQAAALSPPPPPPPPAAQVTTQQIAAAGEQTRVKAGAGI